MATRAVLAAALISLTLPGCAAAEAQGRSRHAAGPATSEATGHVARHPSTPSPPSVRRDRHGKILRDRKERAAFRRRNPCPSTGKIYGACPGYEVDHVRPLACGGADSPGNMQWLSKEANRAKGSEGCRR